MNALDREHDLQQQIWQLQARVSELEQFVIDQREINLALISNLAKLTGVMEGQDDNIRGLLKSQRMLAEALLGVKR